MLRIMEPRIYVNLKEEELGPYSVIDIQNRLDDGKLSPTDKYWHHGRADWSPLSEFDADEAEASTIRSNTGRGAKEEKTKFIVGLILGIVALGITAFIFIRDSQSETPTDDPEELPDGAAADVAHTPNERYGHYRFETAANPFPPGYNQPRRKFFARSACSA